MSMDKPFRVEVSVDAPRDVVWRTLTEPEQIRHWFGWDYDGLDDEIELIFVEHARLRPPDRIEMSDDGLIELEERDGRTVIRATKPGDLDAVEWEDVYGDIEEGWITFFNQLRHRLERHSDSTRRMIVRNANLAALPELPGEPWHSSRYQRGADVRRRPRHRLPQARHRRIDAPRHHLRPRRRRLRRRRTALGRVDGAAHAEWSDPPLSRSTACRTTVRPMMPIGHSGQK